MKTTISSVLCVCCSVQMYSYPPSFVLPPHLAIQINACCPPSRRSRWPILDAEQNKKLLMSFTCKSHKSTYRHPVSVLRNSDRCFTVVGILPSCSSRHFSLNCGEYQTTFDEPPLWTMPGVRSKHSCVSSVRLVSLQFVPVSFNVTRAAPTS